MLMGGHVSKNDLRSVSRCFHIAFVVSACLASTSRSCATATADFDGPLSMKPTFTRVEPSSQSKRVSKLRTSYSTLEVQIDGS